jgi:excisionase family DNA binding protein
MRNSLTAITRASELASGAVDRRRRELLDVDEVADLLRKTRKAIYAMVERRQLPGIRRIGKRLLFRRSEVLEWLDHTCASSAKGDRR